ncbi:Paf1 complex component [Vanrija albida]|uniref:Paf1 complex component n=1 Tax=Vanrija albida TaxID=181172 RepID=A0ABR3QBZ0_9TREE
MSDAENDLFDEETAQSPVAAPSPGAESSKSAQQEDAEGGDEQANDLFGDDDDDEPRPPRSRSTTPARSDRSGSRNPLEYAEEDEDLEDVSETIGNVAVPTWPRLQPSDGKAWTLKLPAYVNIESRPYEPEYYRETIDHDDEPQDNVAAKGKMIGVRNTIRWRWVTGGDGKPQRESNARMLRWSDGSVSLQLGNDLFDVASSFGTTLARPQDASSSKSDQKSGSAESTFLCVEAGAERVLVTERAIAGQLSLVPTSMDSKTHRELVRHVGAQHTKHSRVKILNDLQDQDKVNQLLALAGPQKQTVTKRPSRPRNSQGGPGGRNRRPIKRGSEDEEDYGYGSDDRRAGRRESARDREMQDYDEDDGFVVADSDDDSDAYGSSKKKRKNKKKRQYSDDDLDETELADRRIEAAEKAERDKKRPKTAEAGGSKKKGKSKEYITSDEEEEEDAEGEDEDGEGEGDGDMDLDVESEEED